MTNDEIDDLETQLMDLRNKRRTELARMRKVQIVKDFDYLSHDDLVELYNALVIKLAGSQ